MIELVLLTMHDYVHIELCCTEVIPHSNNEGVKENSCCEESGTRL